MEALIVAVRADPTRSAELAELGDRLVNDGRWGAAHLAFSAGAELASAPPDLGLPRQVSVRISFPVGDDEAVLPARFLLGVGQTWLAFGQHGQAEAAFEAARTAAPGSAWVRSAAALGLALVALEDSPDGTREIAELLAVAVAGPPASAVVRRAEVVQWGLWARGSDLERAADGWERLRERVAACDRGSTERRLTLLVWATASSFLARTVAAEATAEQPVDPVAMRVRARALLATDDPDGAVDALESGLVRIGEIAISNRDTASRVAMAGTAATLRRDLVHLCLSRGDVRGALSAAEDVRGAVTVSRLFGPGGDPDRLERPRIVYLVSGRETVMFGVPVGGEPVVRIVPIGARAWATRVRVVADDLGLPGLVRARGLPAEEADRPATDPTQGLRELWDLLLAPFEALLGDRPLLLAPDGPLWNVPFAALLGPDGRSLVERVPFWLSPSPLLAALQLARPRANGKPRMLGVVDPAMPLFDGEALPELPGAASEGKGLHARFPTSTVLTGREATRSALEAALGGSSPPTVLHLATHGWFDRVSSTEGFLALAPDDHHSGRWTAEEILGRPPGGRGPRLDLELAVLSACQTALGLTPPEGAVSLAHAFLGAGVRSVVGTLWRVDDTSAAEWVTAFYRSWVTHRSPADAARDAALAVRTRWPDPVHWAPFVVMGAGLAPGTLRPTGPGQRGRRTIVRRARTTAQAS
ncbi:MAG: CHAT domain-containing protein [Myxococcota bacterium]